MDAGVVKDLQAALFPVCTKGSYLSSLLHNTLKTNQVEINTDSRTLRPVARLKEPRDLFAFPRELDCPQQAARWPAECQVLEERIHHIEYVPPAPEQYYQSTGKEVQPKAVGEEAGQVVFQYYPMSAVNYFSRSSVGGSKYFLEACPCDRAEGLRFESRFESGNLAKVVKVTECYYELYLRTDLYTNRHMQWFYFRVENTRAHITYRFSIVNLSKAESLYSVGMRPLMYSTKDAQLNQVGWKRCGENITYFRNDSQNGEDEANISFTLSFNLDFPYDNDLVFLAHCYPYTYSDLQDYLIRLQNHPVKSNYSKLRLLCRSLAGNNVYYLTVTAPSLGDVPRKKKAIVITARVHPGETPSSWMMKGFMDFLTGDSDQAKELREKFIFKLVPMLNPDGVIVGNNRCSLTGRDLNRQYRTVIRETYPPVWHTKLMIRRLIEECGIEMYCDLHAHSRKHNTFIYGCENKRYLERRLQEQVFPLMLHKNAADKFSFEDCKFRIQRSKEGTGRVVVWMMGVANSYTMETSFGGSTLGGRSDTHFCTQDYEMMGRYFCETLLDYCDMEPAKERLRNKIINRLLKEGSNADEPTNINLSDYTSDEGDTSSCSDEEKPEKSAGGGVDDFDCCPPLRVPPPSPVLPKREQHKALLHRNIKNCNLEKSPPPVRKVLQVHRTNIDLQTTDPGSDLATEFESGDDSSWRQSFKRNKMAESCVRGVKCGEQCSMPPELIVTPAQVPSSNDQTFNVALMEETNKEEPVAPPQLQPEPGAPDKVRSNHSWHHIRCQSVTRLQSRVVSQTLDDLSNEVQVKLGLSLRQKLWTGVPCTCHSYTMDTLWSNSTLSYNSEEALLVSCSRKLQALQNSLDKPSKKKVLARKHPSPRHCPVPRPVSTDSSPEEDETDRSSNINNKTRKKPKFKKTKSVNSSASVKDEPGRKTNCIDTQKPSKLQSNIPIGKTGQRKQSLKWKFRKSGIVATAVSAIRNLSEHTETASETEANDTQKAITKKKKKRKTITNVPKKRVPSSNSKQSPKKNFKLQSS